MTIDEAALRAAYLELRHRVDLLEHVLGLFVKEAALDQPHGNPTVRFDPRDWRGKSCEDKKFSDCPPEYLEMMAESIRWRAENPRRPAPNETPAQKAKREADNEKAEKFKSLNLRQAAIARTWARRIRQREQAAALAKALLEDQTSSESTGASRDALREGNPSAGEGSREPALSSPFDEGGAFDQTPEEGEDPFA